ncbi:MAG: alpha-amylase family glycosyl hydrolase [Lachnospiraceae bacterium]|nr:alpha-amylase family glycosyl hydrolase [Lachnospiraceae bacterium]
MKKKLTGWLCGVLSCVMLTGVLTGCGQEETVQEEPAQVSEQQEQQQEQKEYLYVGESIVSPREVQSFDSADKYRTFYEIFVYSFWDSNGDGIGDLAGVTEKLDYLNDGDNSTDSDLGITGIWLMPIMPSDTYHKYDVKDYMAIDPAYGTMEDFENLVTECKARNINLIIDLVMNHTSSSHPWFVAACDYLKSIGDGEPDLEECPYVDYYHFHKGIQSGYYRLGNTDWYYEAGFWSEMPDLNLSNENVRAEFEEICKFWLDKGVAGFRLDAVKEFVSDDTAANVEILTWLNDMVKGINPDAYLVGEAWLAQTEYAQYYASGIDSFFDFSFADSTGNIQKFVSGQKAASDYGAFLVRGEQRFAEQNPAFVNAPFYSNHDMDRSAGYYSGAVAEQQIKMAAALNMTMSGNAFLYYGDEIGMLGSGKDENKRIGMRWTADKDAQGMCKGPDNADKNITQNYPALDEQVNDTSSIYTYYKNLIRLRNQFPSIRKGTTEQISAFSDKELCALLKSYEGERVVILYNISEEVKTVDLSTGTLADGTVLNTGMLEATLVSGDTPVAVEGQVLTLPEYSVVVLAVE